MAKCKICGGNVEAGPAMHSDCLEQLVTEVTEQFCDNYCRWPLTDAARLADLEKQLAGADGDVAAFRVHYEAWQEHFNKMSGYLTKISGRDPERAGKLRMDVKEAVERMADVWVVAP